MKMLAAHRRVLMDTATYKRIRAACVGAPSISLDDHALVIAREVLRVRDRRRPEFDRREDSDRRSSHESGRPMREERQGGNAT